MWAGKQGLMTLSVVSTGSVQKRQCLLEMISRSVGAFASAYAEKRFFSSLTLSAQFVCLTDTRRGLSGACSLAVLSFCPTGSNTLSSVPVFHYFCRFLAEFSTLEDPLALLSPRRAGGIPLAGWPRVGSVPHPVPLLLVPARQPGAQGPAQHPAPPPRAARGSRVLPGLLGCPLGRETQPTPWQGPGQLPSQRQNTHRGFLAPGLMSAGRVAEPGN